MKLIISNGELRQEFLALTRQYDIWTWAVAWASDVDFLQEFQEQILSGKKTIRFVVGLHFYQTDPLFIRRFLPDERVRYVEQPTGTFHPKMYLFSNNNDSNWAMLVGSGNLTTAAFSKNQEASILITNEDDGNDAVFKNALSFVNEKWEKAKVFDENDLKSYEISHAKMQPKLIRLSNAKNPTPIASDKEIPVTKMTWDEYVQKVRNESQNKFQGRLSVIKTAKELFERGKPFQEFDYEERKIIAGLPSELEPSSPYFGSMLACWGFKNRIKENDRYISEALGAIPLNGPVARQDYEHFVNLFKKAFPGDNRNLIAPVTRLLAMKRPDVFVCLNGKNKQLRPSFGLPVSKDVKLERYWEDIIERIFDSEWWQNPEPKNEEEMTICIARAAFLDSLYFTW